MEEALGKALELTSADDTLILVTADHSHTFALAGYPDRTANIFNVLQVNTKDCLWEKSQLIEASFCNDGIAIFFLSAT